MIGIELRAIADSPEQLEQVIGLLAGAQQRLIIVDENTVEVAHEALLCRWKLLSKWIEEDLENIRICRRLEVDCREWEETYGKSDDALLTGARLAEVEEWQKRVQPNLTGDEREFLGNSVGRRDRKIQDEIKILEREIQLTDEKYQAQKQRTSLAIASGILAIFTMSFGLLANQRELEIQKREIQVKQQKILTVYAVIERAKKLLDNSNQIDALTTSIEALAQIKELDPEDPSILSPIKSIVDSVQETNRLLHPNKVTVVTFNPQSKAIASATSDGTIWLWSKTGKLQTQISGLSGHKSVVWSLSFSSDGQKLASASGDKTIKIWNAKTGKLLTNFIGHQAAVYDVKFSPDSNNAVSASGDGTVRLWDVKTGKLLKKLDNKGKLLRLDFSRNGSKVAFAGNDNSVNTWDLQDNDSKIIGKHEIIKSSRPRISYITFNSAGNLLASSDYNGFIKLWDVEKNKVLMMIDTKSFIHGLAFSPDSKMLASADGEATIKLWKLGNIPRGVLTKQPEPEILTGHRDEVVWVTFLPEKGNIKIMASASDDRMVKIWRIGDKSSSPSTVNSLLVYSCNSLKNYFNAKETPGLKEKNIKKFCEDYYTN